MDKTGLQHPPVRLQRQQEPRDYPIDSQPSHEVELGPSEDAGGKVGDVAQVAGEDDTPRVIPPVNRLYNLGVDGGDVESELSRRRDGAAVKICEPRRQLCRLRWLSRQSQLGSFHLARWGLTNLCFHVPELDEEKVGPAIPHIAPGIRLRDESRGHGVDGLEGLELALAHIPSSVTEVWYDLGAAIILAEMKPQSATAHELGKGLFASRK